MIKKTAASSIEFSFSEPPRIAIVVSRFNETVTEGLYKGALKWLSEHGLSFNSEDRYNVPGAFEMPLIAQQLAKTGQYDGVVCLGCVIKGDTAHFEYISLGATIGLVNASLTTEIPITFGILTTYTAEQAAVRSQEDQENKGREAVGACIESLALLEKINQLS